MKAFVTGATGVLGRRVTAALVGRGDEVVAVARSDSNLATLRGLGATPAHGDMFDPDFLKQATTGADAVLHLATKIPPVRKAWRSAAWRENDSIRGVATGRLVDAALANGCESLVFPSITFGYEDRGSDWIDESVPWGEGIPLLDSTGVAEAEVSRFAATGGRGVTLRTGWYLAPDASTSAETRAGARFGRAPVFGDLDAYTSSVWADDVATAVLAALGAPSGTYNVADDEPLTGREYCEAVADAFGKRRLKPIPAFVARRSGAAYFLRSQRVSSAKFKDATGWAPEVTSARQAWKLVAAALEAAR